MRTRATEAVGHVRGLGVRVTGHAISAQAWSVKRELELVCDIATRPERPSARVPVSMEECDPQAFDGFDEELRLTSGTEYGQALRRVLVCRAGIRGLHVARDGGGEPIYAQWLLNGEQRDRLRARLPGPWRPLTDDEMTVEFAYTFTRHRGMGVMAAGMGELVSVAAQRDATRVFTYVRPDNVPSLRGCAKVGFRPAREVSTSFRLGFHSVRSTPIGADAKAAWDAATAPRT
jgi:hypothetical protein